MECRAFADYSVGDLEGLSKGYVKYVDYEEVVSSLKAKNEEELKKRNGFKKK